MSKRDEAQASFSQVKPWNVIDTKNLEVSPESHRQKTPTVLPPLKNPPKNKLKDVQTIDNDKAG